jgi:hypothetical protein
MSIYPEARLSNFPCNLKLDLNLVRERGLEPPCLAALTPQISVYTISPLALNA